MRGPGPRSEELWCIDSDMGGEALQVERKKRFKLVRLSPGCQINLGLEVLETGTVHRFWLPMLGACWVPARCLRFQAGAFCPRRWRARCLLGLSLFASVAGLLGACAVPARVVAFRLRRWLARCLLGA